MWTHPSGWTLAFDCRWRNPAQCLWWSNQIKFVICPSLEFKSKSNQVHVNLNSNDCRTKTFSLQEKHFSNDWTKTFSLKENVWTRTLTTTTMGGTTMRWVRYLFTQIRKKVLSILISGGAVLLPWRAVAKVEFCEREDHQQGHGKMPRYSVRS